MKKLLFYLIISVFVLYSCISVENEELESEEFVIQRKSGSTYCYWETDGPIKLLETFEKPDGTMIDEFPSDFGGGSSNWESYLKPTGGLYTSPACLRFKDDWVYRQSDVCSGYVIRSVVNVKGYDGIMYVVLYGDDGTVSTLSNVSQTNAPTVWGVLDSGLHDINKDGYIRVYLEATSEHKSATFDFWKIYYQAQ